MDSPASRARISGLAAVAVIGMLMTVAGCVTRVEEVSYFDMEAGAGEDAVLLAQPPVVVALDGRLAGPAGVLDQYYGGVLGQMREAYLERNLAALEFLLASHDRKSASADVREQIRLFRQLALGLELNDWLEQSSSIRLTGPLPGDGQGEGPGEADRVPLGAPMRFELQVGQAPVPERLVDITLPGDGEAHSARMRAVLRIQDTDARGDTAWIRREIVATLPRSHRFASGPAVLPIEIAAIPAGAAVVRQVEVTVDLVAGFVELSRDGATVDLASPGCRLVRGEFEMLPSGASKVAADPLGVLRSAVQIGQDRYHGHVLLAARFMAAADRPEAVRTLMEWVRLGRPDQTIVAMAALRELAGVEHGRERDRWLQWYSQWEADQRRRGDGPR